MTDKPKFEIVDLGVNHPDYFQGFGVSYTQFNHCTYGIGDTAEEAYQDALDSAAQFSPWAAIDLEVMPEHCPFAGTIDPDDVTNQTDNNDTYYHVGIRWNAIEEAQS